MNDQDRKFKELWEKRKTKGRWKYGLVHGSAFGFLVFVVINLLNLKDQSISEVYFNNVALSQMLTMVLAGILGYSSVKWWMNEKIYKRIADKEESGA
jgi:prolipoprotein diacylglyceryltransferase